MGICFKQTRVFVAHLRLDFVFIDHQKQEIFVVPMMQSSTQYWDLMFLDFWADSKFDDTRVLQKKMQNRASNKLKKNQLVVVRFKFDLFIQLISKPIC